MEKKYTPAEIAELKEYAAKHICPHYAVNADIDKHPRLFAKSDVNYVYDIEGNKYLDTFGSLLTTVCGHNNMEIIDAIYEQLKLIDFFPNFGDHYCIPMIELSKKLEKIVPQGLTSFFYVNSGSEANESAIKIARSYHLQRDDGKRYKVISRKGSYHGTTMATVSATGLSYFTDPYEPMIGDYYIKAPAARCEHCMLGKKKNNCAMECYDELERVILENDPSTISCVIMDPIPGSNTAYPLPPEGYLQKVRNLCDEHGILLIFDEIQTGIGKSGCWFASQYLGVTPDLMTVSKAITNGYVPLGFVAMRQDIYDLFRSAPGKEFVSGNTFGGHNVACAAAIATLDYIEKHDLLSYVKELSQYIIDKTHEMMKRHKIIAGIHGVGLLLAIELAQDSDFTPLNPEWNAGGYVNEYCYQHGLIMRNNGDIIVIAPPFTFTKENVDTMLSIFEDGVTEFEKIKNI